MATVHDRVCIKAWEITAQNGDHFEVVPGRMYTTTPVKDGELTVLDTFWVRAPADCFSGICPLGVKIGSEKAAKLEFDSWK